MAIRYNLEPLEAIDIFYGGRTNGVSENELVRFSERIGHDIPPMLREFLKRYLFLDRNNEVFGIFHPDEMRVEEVDLDGEETEIMVIGVSTNKIIGITPDEIRQSDEEIRQLIGVDLGSDELEIVCGFVENGNTFWKKGFNETLSGKLLLMFLAEFKNADRFLFEGAAIGAVLKKHGVERSRILPSDGSVQRHSVHYDEDSHMFL